MKSSFTKISLLFCLTALLTVMAKTSSAQSTSEFKRQMIKWWEDYISFLKKAKAEPNDQKVIAMFRGATGLIADHKKLTRETIAWKKSHSTKELEEMEKWLETEPHAVEMEKLEEDPKIMERNVNNKELVKAVQDFRMAMIKP